MGRTVLALVLFLAAGAAFSQPTIVIERIDISARRTSSEILISEMRLPKDRSSYTADEIEQAISRLRRLPFVADATYTLESGVTPGARVLHVTVMDETPLHFRFDISGVAQRSGYVMSLVQAGLRYFPGRSGVLDLTLGGLASAAGGGTGVVHFGEVTGEYTRYGLFGTSAFAGIGVTSDYNAANRLISPVVLAGVPLNQTQTIRATYARSGDKNDSSSVAKAEWLLETIDDPYFARRGVSVAIGPQREKLRHVEDFVLTTPKPGGGVIRTPVHIDDTTRGNGVGVDASKYWPRAEHAALWARLNGTYFAERGLEKEPPLGTHTSSTRRELGDLFGGVAYNFDHWRTDSDEFDRKRLEFGAGYHRDWSKSNGFAFERSGPELFASGTYRNRYVNFRVSVFWVNSN
ncbi:MAG TPA: hypothetical protein VGJ82_04215 [Thermoanaerobaculia bacterium]|jgi:hypothetical protein